MCHLKPFPALWPPCPMITYLLWTLPVLWAAWSVWGQLWFILWYWAKPCPSINSIPVPQSCSLGQHRRTLCCFPSSKYLKISDMCPLASLLSQVNCCKFSQHWSVTLFLISLFWQNTPCIIMPLTTVQSWNWINTWLDKLTVQWLACYSSVNVA